MAHWMIATAMIIFALRHASSQGSTSDGCMCEYTRQPPNDLQCSPYLDTELTLDCRLFYPASLDIKTMEWFSSKPLAQAVGDSDLGTMGMLSADMAGIQIQEQIIPTTDNRFKRKRSQLTISGLNDSHVGDYWCRVKAGSEWLVSSDSVTLQPSIAYSNLPACNRAIQFKDEGKCADRVTSPMAPLPEITLTDTEDPVTRNPSTQEMGTTNSVSVTTRPEPTTMQEATSTLSNTTEDGPTFINELYISISVLVVLGFLVFILTPATLCMCIKRRKRGQKGGRDLERVQPVDTESPESLTAAVPAEYLVPQPFTSSLPAEPVYQSQFMYHNSNSFSTAQGHEYEELTQFNRTASVQSRAPVEVYYSSVGPIMTRNQAYSVCESHPRKSSVTMLPELPESKVVIPNPMYVESPVGEGARSLENSNEYVNSSLY